MLKKTLLIVLLGVICMGGSSGGDGPGGFGGNIGGPPTGSSVGNFGGLGSQGGSQGGEPFGGYFADLSFADIADEGVMGGFADTLGGISQGMADLSGSPPASVNPLIQSAVKQGAMHFVGPLIAQTGKAAIPGMGLLSGLVDLAMNPQARASANDIAIALGKGFAGMVPGVGPLMGAIPSIAEGDTGSMGIGGPSPFEVLVNLLVPEQVSVPTIPEAHPPQQAGVAPPAPAPPPQYGLSPQPFGWYGMKRVGQPWVSPPSGAFGNYGGMKRVGA